jgi:hypothetical protein
VTAANPLETEIDAADRGFVTLAFGRDAFLEMAVDCALAIREHHDLPVALLTDETLKPVAERRFPGVFDHIMVTPSRYELPSARKFAVAATSPFRRSLFIDADCILLRNVDDLWREAEGSSFRFVGELLTAQQFRRHHGFPTPYLMRRFGLAQYLKSNSGAFYFEREAGRRIAEQLLACHRDEVLPSLRGGFLGDEIAIGIVGGREGLSVFDGSPMMWEDDLAAFDPHAPVRTPFLHFINAISPSGLAWVVRRIDERRQQWGFATGSSRYWLSKEARARRVAWVSRMLMPFARLGRLAGIKIVRDG